MGQFCIDGDNNTEGQFIGCIICGLDITDRKALEESNTQNKLSFLEKIAQLDRQRSLGMLSASLAHELNQPLNTILLSADLLRQETDKDSIPPNLIQSLTDNIIQCTRHCEQIIANIQKFIKPHELEKHPVDLQDLMKYTTDLLKKEAQFHQVKFHLPASKDEAWTQGDFILLSQVLINIFRNSIDALKHVEQRDVYLELFFNSTNWHLVIKDSGPGLSELVLNKIATPFFTTKHSGLGMGLSISKDIIEQHHGSLLIGNNQTGGAYFEMVLPMI